MCLSVCLFVVFCDGPTIDMLGFEELLDSDEIAGWQVCRAVVARVGGAGRGAWGRQAFMRVTDWGGCGWRSCE